MSLNRYAKRRDQTEPDIVKGLRKRGCQVEQQNFPDLLVRWQGRLYLLEVDGITKNRKRKKAQLDFLRAWEIPIVKTLQQAMACIGLRDVSNIATSAPSTFQPPGTSTGSVGGP